MKTLAALAILALTLAPAHAAADLSGKWSGSFTVARPDGTSGDQGIELNLTQKGKDLTGTAGPNAERQWTLSKGVVEGDKVTFVVQVPDGPLISFTLALANDRLVGEAAGEEDGNKVSAKVDVGRVK